MSAHPEPTNPRRTLTVRGRGVASADPDLVVLSFNIVSRDPSYSAAVEELNRRVEALRSDLEAVGVERTRLKTTGFDVDDHRRYDNDSKEYVFVGYEASHGLRLELPLEKEVLNNVLGKVASSASEASVEISFDVSDRKGLRRRAMRAAVEDAKESAGCSPRPRARRSGRSRVSTTASWRSGRGASLMDTVEPALQWRMLYLRQM